MIETGSSDGGTYIGFDMLETARRFDSVINASLFGALAETGVLPFGREAFEETGWKIAPVRKLGAYRRYTYIPEYDRYAEKICNIFHYKNFRFGSLDKL